MIFVLNLILRNILRYLLYFKVRLHIKIALPRKSDFSLVTLDKELQEFYSNSSNVVFCAAVLNNQSICHVNRSENAFKSTTFH